jgi:uncharacterized protein (DUF427 family)
MESARRTAHWESNSAEGDPVVSETRTVLEPGPDHPITIEPHDGHVVVRRGAAIVAETDRALALREANYPVVLYIPFADVDWGQLGPSEQHTYCPYKGEASYYDLVADAAAGDEASPGPAEGAIWYYPEPYRAVDVIRDHVAFYPDRVVITTEVEAPA